ncbi:MAG: alpha/beta fold hydrolase [Acidobacteriota bacterium]|nr:alpha/beta fold hydrolase [Acidobacteriota bacterium]
MPIFLSGNTSIRIQQLEPAAAKPLPAVLLLHGAGGHIDFWFDRLAPLLSRLGIACYAVHYFDSTGSTRADSTTFTDGHHVPLWLRTISDALTWIAARPNIDPTRIALIGISLGAFLSIATAAHNLLAVVIRAVVEISGGLAQPYSSRVTSSFPPTLILHGESDTVVPVSHAIELNTLLDRLAVPHQMHLLPGEGHLFSPAAQPLILAAVTEFLARHL